MLNTSQLNHVMREFTDEYTLKRRLCASYRAGQALFCVLEQMDLIRFISNPNTPDNSLEPMAFYERKDGKPFNDPWEIVSFKDAAEYLYKEFGQ